MSGPNLDQRLTSVEPPSFTYGGRRYVGRLLSWEQFRALGKELQAIGADLSKGEDGAEQALRALAVETCRTLFPLPTWWQVWVPPAHVVVSRLHTTLVLELLLNFCAALAKTMPQTTGATTAVKTRTRKTR